MVDETNGGDTPADETDTRSSAQNPTDEAEDVLTALAEYDDSVVDPNAETHAVLTVAITETPAEDDGAVESLVDVEAEEDEQKDRLHSTLADVIVADHEPLAAEIAARLFIE